MAEPLFSVIIPTYNRAHYLAEAVESVLRQSATSFECIVVDDASPDPVSLPPDPRITVIRRSTNGGLAAARNTGVEAAQGRFIAFLDDDDVYTTSRLEIALEGLERAPLAVCWSSFLGEDPKPQRLLEGNVHDVILDATAPPVGTVALPLSSMIPFNEDYLASQDLEWWLRITKTMRIATVPRLGYLVRKHSGPRNLNGPRARITFSERLLSENPDYFDSHPRAAAFRWKRIGLLALNLDAKPYARKSFARSLALRPSLAVAKHLVRSYGP